MGTIQRIDVRWLRLPGRFSRPDAESTVLVGIDFGGELQWGEARPGDVPTVESEYSAGVFSALAVLIAPRLVGRTYASANAVADRLNDLRGCTFARSAIDAAAQSREPRSGFASTLVARLEMQSDVGDLVSTVGRLAALGVAEYVLQIGPGLDADLLRPLRSQFPEAVLHGEADGRYADASASLFQLEDFHLASLIQPFASDDLVAHAMLQQELQTPLALSRGLTSPAALDRAIDLGAARALQLHPGRVGPASAASELAASARSAAWRVGWSAPEGEVARSAFFSAGLPQGDEKVVVSADWLLDESGEAAVDGGAPVLGRLTADAEELITAADDPKSWIDRRVIE